MRLVSFEIQMSNEKVECVECFCKWMFIPLTVAKIQESTKIKGIFGTAFE